MHVLGTQTQSAEVESRKLYEYVFTTATQKESCFVYFEKTFRCDRHAGSECRPSANNDQGRSREFAVALSHP
jgi:hypothetical protein